MIKKIKVVREDQKASDWIIPFFFSFGTEHVHIDGTEEVTEKGSGVYWLWWSFYFYEIYTGGETHDW